MFIIGTRFFTWGSDRTAEMMHCGTCGATTQFIRKSGMRFITLFFVIPVIPISGATQLQQCPQCKTRYQTGG